MLKYIPNFLTLCNLACGCVGTVMVFRGEILMGSYFIWGGALFDFLDGFAARMLKKFSTIGKDLDSLADLITFCFLPGTIMFHLIEAGGSNIYLPYIGYLLVIFGATRLAKFNNDTRQSESFYGLPVPANAIFVSAFPFFTTYPNSLFNQTLLLPYVLIGVVLILSAMMNADIKLLSLKFKNFKIKDNAARYFVILASIILLIFFQFLAIPFIILMYVMTSVVLNFVD